MLTWFLALVWPNYAAAFTGNALLTEPTSIARHRFRAFRRVIVFALFGTALGLNLVHGLLQLDIWTGIVAGVAIVGHSLGAALLIPAAARRRTRDLYGWLGDHGLTETQIGVLTKSRLLSLTTSSSLYAVWAATFVIPLRSLRDEPGAAVGGALLGSMLFSPVVYLADYLDRRFRVANQLLLHLTAACRPGVGPQPSSLRIRQDPDLNPNDLWHSGLPRERAALLTSITLLQNLLQSRTRRWRSLDQNALLNAAQPLLDDLAALAASTNPIQSDPAVTSVVRLAFLGDTRMLRQGWAKPHRASDHRAWNQWSIKRMATVITGTIGVVATTAGSVIAVIKALKT